MFSINVILSFLEGILTFISPCILPMIPVYLSFLAGQEINSTNNKKILVINSLGFVLGFTVVFVILGATATSLGMFLKANIFTVRKISGILMLLFGLNFMGIIKLNFINMEKRLKYNERSMNLISAFIFGLIFSLGWSPCVGQFLSVALLMAANSNTLLEGMVLLLTYSIGLGLPFVLVAALFDSLRNGVKMINKYRRVVNIISGLIMIIAGIFTLAGGYQWVSNLGGGF